MFFESMSDPDAILRRHAGEGRGLM